jgi:GNAT superfamily N-acetyltransferase
MGDIETPGPTLPVFRQWDRLVAGHPATNYLPWLAGILCGHLEASCHMLSDGNVLSITTLSSEKAESHQSWCLLPASAKGDLLGGFNAVRAGLWNREWAVPGARDITLAALPACAVRAAIAEFLRLGRAKAWSEGFTCFELSDFGEDAATKLVAAGSLPAGWSYSTLTPDECVIVNRNWKYASPPGGGQERKLRRNICELPSACIRVDVGAVEAGSLSEEQTAELRSNGGLAAWTIFRPDGAMGVLHTLASLRGRGLAGNVSRHLALQVALWRDRELSALGHTYASARALSPAAGALCRATGRAIALTHVSPYVQINPINTSSVRVFERQGFRPASKVAWVVFEQPAPRFTLRPLRVGDGDAEAASQLGELLALINASYAQDDAFFVDMVRSDADNLRAMAREGLFLLGYEQPAPPFLLPRERPAGEASGSPPEPALRAGDLRDPDVAAAAAFDGQGYLPCAWPIPMASCHDTAAVAAAEAAGVTVASSPDVAVSGGASRPRLLCAFYLQPPKPFVDPSATPFTSEGSPAAIAVDAAATACAAGTPSCESSVAASADGASPCGLLESASSLGGDRNGPSTDPFDVPQADAGVVAAAGRVTGLRSCHLGMMTIAPDLKRLGLAQRLLEAAVLTARHTYGAQAVDCHVVSVKPWLRRFYESNGFEVVGAAGWPAELKDSLKMPAYFHAMVKTL